jgi:hypothetical protein
MGNSEKKTIFVGLSSGLGPLPQAMPIVKELSMEGYNIYCNIADSGSEIIKSAGYNHIDLPYVELPKTLTSKGYKWWDLDHYWGRFGYLDYDYVHTTFTNYIKIIQEIKPSLILCQFCPPAIVAAKVLNIPVVCLTQACFHPQGKGGRVTWWEQPTEEYERASRVVNRVLSKFNIDPINGMEDLNVGDLTIVPSCPELDPINSNDVFYIGPLL